MDSKAPQIDEPRRDFFEMASRVGLALGLTAAYGTFAAFLGRFLFPSSPPPTGWMYVAPLERMGLGDSILFRTPQGATVNIAKQQEGSEETAFIALSSTCPHLGCQVHWEAQNERFFCPCHNGTFAPDGKGIGGPPGDAGQSLPRYPLRVEAGLLYIEVSTEELAMGEGTILDAVDGPPGPGHDPCLFTCPAPGRPAPRKA